MALCIVLLYCTKKVCSETLHVPLSLPPSTVLKLNALTSLTAANSVISRKTVTTFVVLNKRCGCFQCLPADMLAIYSISEQSRVDEQGLQKLCPTMLQQLDAGSCRAQNKKELNEDNSPRPSDSEGQYAFVSDY